jgi:Holliday junction resolvase RusA-like endonuclease
VIYHAMIDHDLMPHPRLTHGSKWAQSRGRTGAYLDNRNALAWLLKTQKTGGTVTVPCSLRLTVYLAHRRRADWDNLAKSCSDALQVAGIISDDRLIEHADVRIFRGAKKGMVGIVLTELEGK